MTRARLSLGAVCALICATTAAAEGAGDAARGEVVFRQCQSCHEVGADAENRVAPHLNMVFGRAVGTVEGFRYSNALRNAGTDGLVWQDGTLDAFLTDPRGYLPGTRMSYRGLPDPQDRMDLLAYLHRFSGSDEALDTAVGDAQDAYPVAAEILAIAGDPAYGEYLSGECTSCHQADGAASGIPSITHWPVADFVAAMHAYKDGARIHPVMQMMAARLSNEEIAALAAYFETTN